MRVFNRLKTERVQVLGDYRAKLETEKFTLINQERLAKLDEEIEILIKQERALFFIGEKGYAALKIEHEKLVGGLTNLQTERATWMAEMAKQDSGLPEPWNLRPFSIQRVENSWSLARICIPQSLKK